MRLGTALAEQGPATTVCESIVAQRAAKRVAQWSLQESAMQATQHLHVPPKPEPIPPGSPPGDLPVDPDTDQPEVDLPPLSPPVKEIEPPQR